MSKLERFLLAALLILVVLALSVIFLGPRLIRRSSGPAPALAVGETETLTARVIEVLEEGALDIGDGIEHPYQVLLVRVESGSLAGEEIVVEEGTVNIIGRERLFARGDHVYLERVVGLERDRFFISDPVRTIPLLLIAGLFMGLVVLVGRGRGVRSLLGTLVSVLVILAVLYLAKGIVLPGTHIEIQLDPVGTSIVGSIVLLTISTYLVYGWTYKAHAAVTGMMISLMITGVFAGLSVAWTRLTGLSEEGGFLLTALGPDLNLKGLLLSGIIIGSLGVLDDICVGQASAVFELVNANRDLGWRSLFRSSLNIGRDHIAAMVNTLLLAYVGASMPLMLAFVVYNEPLWRRINREPIAEEIVRTMVGSVGLILAVPITGLIASLFARWAVRREAMKRVEAGGHGEPAA